MTDRIERDRVRLRSELDLGDITGGDKVPEAGGLGGREIVC
jgi:hypothetical protein